jgi:8-oxo-dGTP diphosphatase
MTGPPSQPRVGVGALIIDEQGRVLLVKRRRNPEADHWGIPGGKVDFGERVADTCAREILEEVGLEIEVRELVCLVDQIDIEAGTHWVSPVFRARVLAGEAINREPEAIAAIGWFEPGGLPAPLTLSTRRALNL